MEDYTDEVWKPCDTGNWSDPDYEVSSKGRVRHVKTGKMLSLRGWGKQGGKEKLHLQYQVGDSWWHPNVLVYFVFNRFLEKGQVKKRTFSDNLYWDYEDKPELSSKKFEVEKKVEYTEEKKSKPVVKSEVVTKKPKPKPVTSELTYEIVSNVEVVAQSLYKPPSTEDRHCVYSERDKSRKPVERKIRDGGNEGSAKSPYIKTVASVVWQYKTSARQRKCEWGLTDEQALEILIRPCHYCGCEPGVNNMNGLNGIDRVDNEKGYIVSNVVSCCGKCNLMKGRHSVDDFLAHIEAIHKFQGSK